MVGPGHSQGGLTAATASPQTWGASRSIVYMCLVSRVRGRFLPLQGLVESGLGRRRERQAEVRSVGLAAPLATAQSHGYPRVQGRLGNGVSCVQETGGHGMMATPTPGPLGPCSGLEVSRVPAAELLPWKGNSDGVVSSGSWV